MGYKSHRKRVICVGDLNFDVIGFCKSRLHRLGDEFLSSVKTSTGGGAGNVAVGLARLGVTALVVSRVGRDLFGRYVLDKLSVEKVETTHIQVDPNVQTGFVLALVSTKGERTLYSFRGANVNLNQEQIKYGDLAEASFIHVSGYSLLEDPQRAASLKLIDFAQRIGCRVSVDLGPELSRIKRADLAYLTRRSNLLFISHKAALLLYRTRSWIHAINQLLRAGPDIVVAKAGEKGCYVGKDQIRLHVSGFPVRAVDTTGAGDAFNSGFLFGILNNWTIEKTAIAANAVAAMKIRRAGAVDGLPSKKELMIFLQNRPSPEVYYRNRNP